MKDSNKPINTTTDSRKAALAKAKTLAKALDEALVKVRVESTTLAEILAATLDKERVDDNVLALIETLVEAPFMLKPYAEPFAESVAEALALAEALVETYRQPVNIIKQGLI